VLNTTIALAEEHSIDLNAPGAIRQTLEQQLSKRVKVKLESGQDLEGKVAKVGAHAVLWSELSGTEFFDATIKLDEGGRRDREGADEVATHRTRDPAWYLASVLQHSIEWWKSSPSPFPLPAAQGAVQRH
jgi:hypothetical protein